jgi:3-oxoacyl-[acyl-carrier protein] reductase
MSAREAKGAAIVTGAARNIGRATTLRLAELGYDIVVHSGTDKAGLAETAAQAATVGARTATVLGDLSDPAVTAEIADAAQGFGGAAVLVNNAALRQATPFEEMTLEQWRRVMTVNLDAAFLCTRAVIGQMLARGWGRVINMGGLSGHIGAFGRAHVIASKAALVGFSKALAFEYAARGITANTVVPGEIDTTRGAAAGPKLNHPGKGPPPVGRLGQPEEVANVIAMLCGPHSDYLTGQTYHVNGGAYLP